jgi:hypothetical protein
MKYYKELDWDSSVIQQELLAHAEKTGFVTGEIKATFTKLDLKSVLEASPALVEFLQIANLIPVQASYYVTEQQSLSNIHKDNSAVMARINFPVLNCSNTVTAFYKVAPGSLRYEIQRNGIAYWNCVDPKPKMVASVRITRPTVLLIKEPHNVMLTQEGIRRISLTLEVSPDPVHFLL